MKVRPPRREAPALLETGQLWEIATELRPLLEQTARAGSTITWPQIHKRLPGLPRLHADDQCVLLWLVDEDGRKGEPLLSALVTVGDRQMHPRCPAVAEELGWTTQSGTRPHTAWSYEVLKAHQHWRHRRQAVGPPWTVPCSWSDRSFALVDPVGKRAQRHESLQGLLGGHLVGGHVGGCVPDRRVEAGCVPGFPPRIPAPVFRRAT
ncbi:hypothetical protein [Streptomyces sp. NPDC056387]|uniref:hypothetical protein n=1 Tax=Streptomyces sp. NPDC056387 TaxID=3345803 RepID=UPI0035DB6230